MLKQYIVSSSRKKKSGIVPVFPESSSIPKIIHQTYHKKELPKDFQANVAKLKRMNPSWDYRLYDDNDILEFIQTNYGKKIVNYYQRINPKYGAARADLFRYLLIYKVGGIYLDVKSSLEKSLGEVVGEQDRFLLAQWKNGAGEADENWGLHEELESLGKGEYQQWHIVSVAGHPFLRAVIEDVLHNIDNYNPGLNGVGKDGVLRLTGPIVYTLAIFPLLNLYKHKFVDYQNDLGFRYSIYSDTDKGAHKKIFTNHYSLHKESIVRLNFFGRILWFVLVYSKKIFNFTFRS